ncbi:MAG: hypothetical protein LBE35_07800 [Clostridiales bacterium]|jgi:uncharacterized membrane protein|nr:hypothetical protein [Clostridiales bacterium]
MNKSVFGLSENLAAALAYVGIFFSGIVVLVMERENKFVRFAALQSTIFFLVMSILMSILGFFGGFFLVGWIFRLLGFVLGITTFAAWAYLTFMAFRGQSVKLPILGEICWEQVHK